MENEIKELVTKTYDEVVKLRADLKRIEETLSRIEEKSEYNTKQLDVIHDETKAITKVELIFLDMVKGIANYEFEK